MSDEDKKAIAYLILAVAVFVLTVVLVNNYKNEARQCVEKGGQWVLVSQELGGVCAEAK